MKAKLILISLVVINNTFVGSAYRFVASNQNHTGLDSIQIKGQNVRVVFWNVENLYDPYDDTTKNDEEFTRDGPKRWTYGKFSRKLNYVAKTLLAAGAWSPPTIIGLCEVENRYVLNKLIYETPLNSSKYKLVHHDSPDIRGVDVALLYRSDQFKVLSSKNIAIRFPFDTLSQTREILMVKGIMMNCDTQYFFVNHWPSRRGGEEASRPRRAFVASRLRREVDSVLSHNSKAAIVIMGDFNDEPLDESLKIHLGAGDPLDFNSTGLVNLMLPKYGHEGTHKFKDHWGLLDQFIVSTSMLDPGRRLSTSSAGVGIFSNGFLMLDDDRYFGTKPSRTYAGPRYLGGFSDHLPVSLTITVKK